jgi:hypothetical protein
MRKLWRDHQLFCIVLALTVFCLIVGTWAAYFEYSHNEQGYPEGHYAFFSKTFAAYWVMQVLLGGFVPELWSILILLAGAAMLRERWESTK